MEGGIKEKVDAELTRFEDYVDHFVKYKVAYIENKQKLVIRALVSCELDIDQVGEVMKLVHSMMADNIVTEAEREVI